MNKNKTKNQAGFTLLEAVISTVLAMAVIAGFGAIIQNVTFTSTALSETADRDSKNAELIDILKKHFNEGGRGLTTLSSAPFTGDYGLSFVLNRDFGCSTDGSGNTLCVSSTSSPSSRMIPALISFAPNSDFQASFTHEGGFKMAFANTDGAAFLFAVEKDTPTAGQFYLNAYENGVLKQSQPLGSGSPYGKVKARFGRSFLNNTPYCQPILNYTKSDNQQITYQGNILPCGSKDKEITANLAPSARLSNVVASGSNLHLKPIFRGSDYQFYSANNYPPLPYNESYNSALPISLGTNEIIIVSGEETKFALGKTLNFNENPQPTQLCVAAGQTLATNSDSPYLLVNQVDRFTMLFQVKDQVVINNQNCYTIEFITTADAPRAGTWRGFYDIYILYGFKLNYPVGSTIIHLKPPRRIYYNRDESALYERVGNLPWTLIASNIRDFKVTQQIVGTTTSYQVSYTVVSEGAETEESTNAVNFTVSPRALNATLDIQ